MALPTSRTSLSMSSQTLSCGDISHMMESLTISTVRSQTPTYHPDPVTQGQRSVQRISLQVRPDLQICVSSLTISHQVSHDAIRLQIEHRMVRLHHWSPKRLTSRFPFALHKPIPLASIIHSTRSRSHSFYIVPCKNHPMANCQS